MKVEKVLTCNKCDRIIEMGKLGMNGHFYHCSACDYSVCRRCSYVELLALDNDLFLAPPADDLTIQPQLVVRESINDI